MIDKQLVLKFYPDARFESCQFDGSKHYVLYDKIPLSDYSRSKMAAWKNAAKYIKEEMTERLAE